jgi:ATP-dependent RNA helicase DDX51/DBP6
VLLSAVASLKEHVLEFSSLNSGPERAAALAAFRAGNARILVASDGMTRGMDVPSVTNVVNYEAPVYAKTYVHRAGRTARGGREGGVHQSVQPTTFCTCRRMHMVGWAVAALRH